MTSTRPGEHEDGHMFWDTATAVAMSLLDAYADGAAPVSALSVNVPNRPLPELRGARRARLAPVGGPSDRTGDTDIELLTAGHVTLTALAALDRTPGNADPLARRLDEQLQPHLVSPDPSPDGRPFRPAARPGSTTRGGPP